MIVSLIITWIFWFIVVIIDVIFHPEEWYLFLIPPIIISIVISVLDQAGTVKNEYDYDAFGNAITEKETVSNPYRYAGYYQDSESGLYYLQSRYYKLL